MFLKRDNKVQYDFSVKISPNIKLTMSVKKNQNKTVISFRLSIRLLITLKNKNIDMSGYLLH